MGRKFSRWVKNTVGKGEIARREQFLLFLQCFHMTSLHILHSRKNLGLFGKGLKRYLGFKTMIAHLSL